MSLLNILFSEISRWCTKNKLTVHPTKCKVMIISRRNFIGPLQNVKWENTTLDYTNTIKVLGVIIDNKLSWEPHIKVLMKSLNVQLKPLKKY